MAVSGTATFDLDIIEIIEEAYERCNVVDRTGYDMRSARRSLNLLFIEWANKGYNLWTVEERSLALVYDTGSYQLAADLVDLIDFVVRKDERDLSISRVPLASHAQRNDKNQRGRPHQIFIDRQRQGPMVHLWPIPDENSYTLVYWGLRRINDAGAFTNNADLPYRFLPAIIAGLAAKLAEKKAPDRVATLEDKADRLFAEAADEDRDKSDYQVWPEVSRI